MTQTIGRYEIERELGQGGMATVYLGRDPLMKRQVAVKVLPRQFTADPHFRARFQREAEIIAALEHPHIVPVFDYGEHEGQPYLVMRYMTGGSLADRLQNGPLLLAEAARIFAPLASALDEAHSKNIIHRDLKPHNILFDSRGEPYISDFGIAKLIVEASTRFTGSAVLGTPMYMSPEQWRADKTIDGRADVYALGGMLFEMLTGKPPYEADTPAQLMYKHLAEPPPRLLDIGRKLPDGCDAIIAKAMAKEREARYATAGELAGEVRAILESSLRKSPLPPPTQKPAGSPRPGGFEPAPASPYGDFTPTIGPRPTPDAAPQIAPTIREAIPSAGQRPVGFARPNRSDPKLRAVIGIGGVGIASTIIVVAVLAFFSIQQSQQPTPAATDVAASGGGDCTPTTKQWSAPPEMTIEASKQYTATITLAKGGQFTIQLFPDKAPITVNSFVFLAREGFFNCVTFHRVLEGFMAQGGDPTGTGVGGPGYQFVNEDSDLKFDKAGVVAMANAGRDTNGSQFFITFAPTEHLNGGYTIFGQVTDGMDVVNGITRRDPNTGPTFSGDVIASVTITEQ